MLFTPGETTPREVPTETKDLAPVKWVFLNNRQVGNGTQTFPSNPLRFLPISSHNYVYAVVGYNPDEEQLRLAQQLADAGADVIIGNHAHNIQPVEWLNDGKTICFYALGNMINGQLFPDYTTYDDVSTGIGASLVLNKTINPDGSVSTSIDDVKIDLLYTWTDYYETFKNYWYKDLDDSVFPGYQEFYQHMIDDVVHAYDDSFEIGL